MELTPSGTDRLLVMAQGATVDDLPSMVLEKVDLPADFAPFHSLGEQALDNDAVAKASGGRLTTASLAKAGRLGGFERAFAIAPGAPTLAAEPADVLQASAAAHLFERPEDVRRWIDDEFVAGLRRRVNTEDPDGQRIVGVEMLAVEGFFSHSAALLVVRELPGGLLATTVVNFQLGRLLGEASVIAKVDKAFLELAADLGRRLERQMVRVILDGR